MMMEFRSWSWIVELVEPAKTIQVNADRVSVDSTGGLSFYNKTKAESGEYLSLALAAGRWSSCSVMSQMTGYQNGFVVLTDE